MNVWAFRIAGFLQTDTERPSATEVAVGASLIALHQHTRDRDVNPRGDVRPRGHYSPLTVPTQRHRTPARRTSVRLGAGINQLAR